MPVVVYLLPLWLCGALLAHAMAELNLFDLGWMVRRGLTAGILIAAAVGVYLALFAGLARLVDATTAWAVAGLLAASLMTLASPSRRSAARRGSRVEDVLFPGQRAARDLIHSASRELARLRDVPELGASCVTRRCPAWRPRARGWSGDRAAVRRGGGSARRRDVERLVLAAGDPMVPVLAAGLPVRVAPHRARGEAPAVRSATRGHARSACTWWCRSPPTATHVGGLLLGPRTDGRPYTREDELLLETLAAQTSVALENARAWEEVRRLEQRLAAENLYLREEVQHAREVDGHRREQSRAARRARAGRAGRADRRHGARAWARPAPARS